MRGVFSGISKDINWPQEDIVGKKIVLADDSQTFHMYAGLLMKRLKYNVIPAYNGLECLNLLKTTKPDAVLLDLYLPALSGFKVLQNIKTNPQTASLPVIMISGESDPEVVTKCMESGAFDYVTKPIKIARLHSVLEKCFFAHRGTNRKHLREKFNRNLKVYCGGKEHEYYAETLSEGGVYLRTIEPFPIGTAVEITLQLDQGLSISASGTVIYVRSANEPLMKIPPGMAIKFLTLPASDAALLKSYVTDLLAKDILESQDDRVIEK